MITVEPSSFRDRSGYVFREEGTIFRRILEPYRRHWEALGSSGLLEELQSEGLLIPHEELDEPSPDGIATLQPEAVPFISYPYEWSFSQLKDAALLTLEIQRRAMEKGFVLKDASAYNIQFLRGRPVLIDTLSFKIYEEGRPWIAYRQFCRHFLAPLALMARVHPDFGRAISAYIDGIPLDLASRALPGRTHFHPGLALHIHLHAKAEGKSGEGKGRQARVSKAGMLGLVDSLRRTIEGLNWRSQGTVWADYYSDTNYSDAAMARKAELVRSFIEQIKPRPTRVWDLGANTGQFSAIAAETGAQVLAWDVDSAAVDRHYCRVRDAKIENVLPLMQDLTQPSPGLGWANAERPSFVDRSNADALMALALVHHLAIGNNVPLARVADFFAALAPYVIVEFVPKSDSQVQRLLASREDIFEDYLEAGFENALGYHFDPVAKEPIDGSERTLYLFKRRPAR